MNNPMGRVKSGTELLKSNSGDPGPPGNPALLEREPGALGQGPGQPLAPIRHLPGPGRSGEGRKVHSGIRAADASGRVKRGGGSLPAFSVRIPTSIPYDHPIAVYHRNEAHPRPPLFWH